MSPSHIDEVDYAILTIVEEYDAVWKKRVHDLILERRQELPHMETVSVQTVGRRINKLQDAGLLESCILSPDELNRDLIIGYSLSDKGTTALQEKRDRWLQNEILYISEQWVVGDAPVETGITREAFLKLITDKFAISESVRTDVMEDCTTAELFALIGFYFLLRDLPTIVSPEAIPRLAKIIEAAPQIREVFTSNTIVKQLAEMLEEGMIDVPIEVESLTA